MILIYIQYFLFCFYRRIRIPSIVDSDPNFSQHKYLNFRIGNILLELQIQQISINDKHLLEDFGIFNSLT